MFPAYNNLLSPWLPIVAPRAGDDAGYWMPDLHEQVLCLMDSTDFDSGFVIGSIYSRKTPPPTDDGEIREIHFKDGTSVTYDRGSGKLTIDCVGDVVIRAGGKIDVTASGNLTLKGARVDLNP
jgi:phage baseplate assembly protein V